MTDLLKRVRTLEERMDALEHQHETIHNRLTWLWSRLKRFHKVDPAGHAYEMGSTLRIQGRPAILRMQGIGRKPDPHLESYNAAAVSDGPGVAGPEVGPESSGG